MSERFIKYPNLPSTAVTLLAAGGLCEDEKTELFKRGVRVLDIIPEPRLQKLSAHADLLVHYYGDGKILLSTGQTENAAWFSEGLIVTVKNIEYSSVYPKDAKLNFCELYDRVVFNPKTADYLSCKKPIAVKQGYTKCSVAVISRSAIITEDKGIAEACSANGIDVLLINPGGVFLDGYEYGFFGGCGGLISKNEYAFAGDITRHPQYEEIKDFMSKYGVAPLSLDDGKLRDIGSIIQIKERTDL